MLVPKHNEQGQVIGHIPNRASKNPVVGVVPCPAPNCTCAATVHNPKGKRSGNYYLICDEHKTNQTGGQSFQDWIRENMKPTVEELGLNPIGQNEAEKPKDVKPIEATENAALAVVEPEQVVSEEKAPVSQEQADPEAEAETENKPRKIGLFAAVGALIGSIIAIAA